MHALVPSQSNRASETCKVWDRVCKKKNQWRCFQASLKKLYKYVEPCLRLSVCSNREPAVNLPDVVRGNGLSPPDFVVHLLGSDWLAKFARLSLVGCQGAGDYSSVLRSLINSTPRVHRVQVCSLDIGWWNRCDVATSPTTGWQQGDAWQIVEMEEHCKRLKDICKKSCFWAMRSIQGKLLLRLLLICSCARAEDPVSKVSNWYYLSITLPFWPRDFIQTHALTAWQKSYFNLQWKYWRIFTTSTSLTAHTKSLPAMFPIKRQRPKGVRRPRRFWRRLCGGQGAGGHFVGEALYPCCLTYEEHKNIKSITNVFNRRVFSMARWLPSARLPARWRGPWLTNRQVFSYIDFWLW